MSYACTDVVRVDQAESKISCSDLIFDGDIDGTNSDGKLAFKADTTDYADGTFTPGVYTVTITGTVVGSVGPQEKTTTFDLTLVDPCDPPTSVTGVDFAN